MCIKWTIRSVVGMVFTCGLMSPALALPSYTLTVIGALAEGAETEGYDLNEGGQVTGLSGTVVPRDVFRSRAFVYDGTSLSDLGTLGGTYSWGFAINDSGLVVGESQTAGGDARAFLHDGSGMADLGTLGGSSSRGVDINGGGQVTGWSKLPGGETRAFLYSDGTMEELGTLGGRDSYGRGINSSGQVTGDSLGPVIWDGPIGRSSRRAFVHDGSTMKDIGALVDDGHSQGIAINDSGWVTGWSQTTGDWFSSHAFIYDGTALRDLGTLNGVTSTGYDINNNGQVTGTSCLVLAYVQSCLTSSHGFLWDDGAMYDLNDLVVDAEDWTVLEGRGINDLGQIVGRAMKAGVIHTVLLDTHDYSPVPIPGAIWLLGAGLLVIVPMIGRKVAG